MVKKCIKYTVFYLPYKEIYCASFKGTHSYNLGSKYNEIKYEYIKYIQKLSPIIPLKVPESLQCIRHSKISHNALSVVRIESLHCYINSYEIEYEKKSRR